MLKIILKLCIGFLLSIALSLNYVLSPPKTLYLVCHRISVFSLYHIGLLLVQGGVTHPIRYSLLMTFIYRVHKSKRHFDTSFCVAGPNLWNSLLLGSRSANSLGAFLKLLKSHLFDLAFHQDQ